MGSLAVTGGWVEWSGKAIARSPLWWFGEAIALGNAPTSLPHGRPLFLFALKSRAKAAGRGIGTWTSGLWFAAAPPPPPPPVAITRLCYSAMLFDYAISYVLREERNIEIRLTSPMSKPSGAPGWGCW